MARVTPPEGYDSWNVYIEEQANASLDQSRTARMLIKRDIKLGEIASVDRKDDNDLNSVRYRPYNAYNSPGTFSPTLVHPWSLQEDLLLAAESNENIQAETGDNIELEII